MRIWPYLYEYFKTNYFTFILLCVVVSCILMKYLPHGDCFRRSQDGKKTRRLLLVVCLLGILLRVGWLSFCEYRPAFHWDEVLHGEQTWTEYDEINITAEAMTHGVWFRGWNHAPQARRPIGYPVFLGFFYTIFGANTMVLYSLSLLLFAGTVFLLYALASQMFNSRVGLLSALLFSLYPLSIYSISLPLDEHLFLPLWFLGLYLLFKEIRGEPVRGAVWWYGLLFGYATMTRTHTIFMPLVVAYAFLLIRCSWKKILSVVFIIFIIGQLINLPWIIRNYRQWRTYVPYTATFFTVYAANNPSVVRADNNGKIPEHGEEGYSPELVRAIGNYDVPTMEKLAKRETIRWIVRRPGSFLILGVEKVLHFMGTNRQRGIWVIDLIEEALKKQPSRQLPAKIKKSTEEMAFGAYYLVLYLFLFGLVWVSRNWKRRSQVSRHSLLVIGLCFLFYLAEHFIIYPERKYRFPLELLMLIVASAFINFLICDFKLFTKDRRFFCKPNRQC